jgi:uncharacterized protein (TIGR02231 family)
MRIALAAVLLAATILAGQASEVKGVSHIDAVTVYPTGAEITRIAKLKLEAGEHSVLFADLPAQTLTGSIRVEGKATAQLDIRSVDTRRIFVPRTDVVVAASERKRIEEEIEKLKDEKALSQAEMQAIETQKALLVNLAQLPNRPVAANAGGSQPNWGELIGLIGERMAQAQKSIFESQIRLRETDRKIQDLERRLTSIAPAQEERTEVTVSVIASAPLEADFVVRYQVANAAWLPYYDARLATGTKSAMPKLQLERRASVQQRSGESWADVTVTLSTARLGAGTAAPELATQIVDFEADAQRPPPPVAAPAGAMRRMERGATTAAEEGDALKSKLEAQLELAREQHAQIDAQAFQALYAIPGRVTVLPTGEIKRVLIDIAQLDVNLSVRAVPRRDQTAYLYVKFTLARGTPVLAGAVSLFRDATFVGNGRLPLLAPGEEHELGFGVDDQVRVRHAIADEKRGETGIISASRIDARNFKITIKNLHERAVPVTVFDQMPVSQNQDIKVDMVAKNQPARRDVDDKRGVMAWDFKLEPDEERAIEFGYRVTWPAGKRVIYSN